MSRHHRVEWFDKHREPQVTPNPDYPNGVELDMSDGAIKTCRIDLPYPAKRCGVYAIMCKKCGLNMIATTAGRPDDPRRIIMGCHAQKLSSFPGVTKIDLLPNKRPWTP